MKKLTLLAALLALALSGCIADGIKVDADLLTDCVIQCATYEPLLVITADGDTLNLQDYREWIFKDGMVELKDKR